MRQLLKTEVLETLAEAESGLSVLEVIEKIGRGDRVYVSRVLNELVKEGKVGVRKEGRSVKYSLKNRKVFLEEDLDLTEAREDEIWEGVRKRTEIGALSEKAGTIMYFAFTEMLNNAIDHSRSGIGYVKIWEEDGNLKFIVRDRGIGIFRSVMVKRGFQDEVTAIQEMMKGKLTTAPERHSGEGVFWTSKIADKMVFSSYEYRLTVDNVIEDYAIEKVEEEVIGTEVYFEIEKETGKSLIELFREYSFDESRLTLDTTMIQVKLYQAGEAWISRSQAKRILVGLERYKKVIFDFQGIPLVGQAFADEIFRVFRREHPEMVLEPRNMNDSVRLMVERALNDTTGA